MKTKSRSSTTHWVCPWWVDRDSDHSIIAEGTFEYDVQDKFEEISYVNNHGRFNPCLHKKYESEWTNPLIRFVAGLPLDHHDNSTVLKYGVGGHDSPESRINYLLTAAGVGSFDWPNFYQRAIEKMTPTLESGFSLGNFMYEIREIRSLVKWWDLGRTFMDNAANAYLNYSFGLRPFLMDLKNLLYGLFTVKERLASMKAGAGKLQVRHYSETANYLSWDEDWTSGATHVRGECFVPKLTYSATMTYTYQFPELDKTIETLVKIINPDTDVQHFLALLDSMGLNLDLRILWDAVPYSFIADWFFNVGDFLSQLRKKWVPITITIKDFGVSVRMPFHGYTERRGDGVVPSEWVPRSTYSGRYYHRRPVKVDDRSFSVNQIGDLTLRKFILGSLLIRQRL